MRRLSIIALAALVVLAGCDKDLYDMMPDRDKDRYFEDEAPEDATDHTFGEHLFFVLYHDIEDDLPDGFPADPGRADLERVAAYRNARQEALWPLKDDLIAAADAVTAGALLDTLPDYVEHGCREFESALECSLRSMLFKIDDGTLPRMTRILAQILRDLLDREAPGDEDRIAVADDNGDGVPDWIEAEVFLSETNLLFTKDELVELAHQYFSYPEVYEFVQELARLAEGLDVTGQDAGTVHVLPELLTAVADELADIDVGGAVRAIDVNLLERVGARITDPDVGHPTWVVRADDNGNPKVTVDPDSGSLRAPFVDADGDGCADVDDDSRPVDAQGQPIDIAPFAPPGSDDQPRDLDGRVLVLGRQGDTLYEYVNTKETIIGSTLRTLRQIIDARVATVSDFDRLTDWLAELLGYPAAPQVLLPGVRFNDDRFPFLTEAVTLGYQLLAVARLDRPEPLTAGLADLVGETCAVALDGTEARRCLDVFSDAVAAFVDLADDLDAVSQDLTEHTTLGDELLPFVRDLLDPALVPAGQPVLLVQVLRALEDPALATLGPSFARMMRFRDEDLTVPVDPASYRASAAPDTYGDRSAYQRFFHLICDTNGAAYAPDTSFFPGLPEFAIENMATFYMDGMVCNATVPLIFKTVVAELNDDTLNECAHLNPADPPNDPEFPMHVSARQLARFINTDYFFGNALGNEGKELKDYNGDMLIAFENAGAYEAFQPVVQVFSDNGQTQLLADLIWLLHAHFSTHNPAPPNPAHPHPEQVIANYRPFEPVLADALEDATGGLDLVTKLRALVAAMDRAVSAPGGTLLEELATTVDVLTDPEDFVADRGPARPGDLRPGAPVPQALDGATWVNPDEVTHLHAVLDALRRYDDAHDLADPVIQDRFEDIANLVIDRFLLPGWEDGTGGYWVGELLRTVLEPSADLFAEEVAECVAEGTYLAELDEELLDVDEAEADIRDALTGATLAAGVRFLVTARRDPQLRNLFRRLVNYLIEPTATGAEPVFARDPYTNLSRLIVAVLQLKASGESQDAITTTLRLLADVLAAYRDEILEILVDLDDSIEANSVLIDDRGQADRKTLFVALRNLFAPADTTLAEYPFESAARAFKVLGRVDPTLGEADLDARDVHRMLLNMLRTLEDEQHGMERLYRIVCERKRHDSADGENPCAAWLGAAE